MLHAGTKENVPACILDTKVCKRSCRCQSARKELPVVDPVGGKFTV